MKKTAILLLILSMVLALPVSAAEKSCAVIGADLTDEQIEAVYADFGVSRGDVTELTMTNKEERELFDGKVPDEQLGTKSISCVFLKLGGDGITVSAKNTDWCTEAMYISALTTAGVENAEIIVTAPFPVSGTSALAGIYEAYEHLTGETLDDESKNAGIFELLTSGELIEELGRTETMTLITELKLILNETSAMTDDELADKIDSIAGDYKIKLNDYQREKLVELSRKLQKLDIGALEKKVGTVRDTLEKMGEYREKAASVLDVIVRILDVLRGFFVRILSIFR